MAELRTKYDIGDVVFLPFRVKEINGKIYESLDKKTSLYTMSYTLENLSIEDNEIELDSGSLAQAVPQDIIVDRIENFERDIRMKNLSDGRM